MSKTNDTSNLDHRELTDSELDAVTGGKLIDAATPKLHEAASKGTHLPEVVLHLYWWNGWRKIMSNAKLDDHRPLADSELDAVTGGLVVPAIIQPLIALDISRQPANAAAMAAWNDLLRQNGYWGTSWARPTTLVTSITTRPTIIAR
jgi:Type VI secretion system effector, Hcp